MEAYSVHLMSGDKKRDSDNWQRRKPARRGSEDRKGQRDSKKDGTHHDGREGITPRKSPFFVLAEMAMKPRVRYGKEEDRNNDKKTHDNPNHPSKHSHDIREQEADYTLEEGLREYEEGDNYIEFSAPKKPWWERVLEQEGMGNDIGYGQDGSIVRLGHGVKSEEEEQLEDDGGHSQYCPINLGRGDLDQPNDRPVEDNFN